MATDPIGVLAAALDEAVAVEPTVLGDGEAIVALHCQLERLEAVFTRAVAAFDAGGTWSADGARTASAWVATKCRQPFPAVRHRLRLGRELRHMAETEEAWLAGDIGKAQVGVLAEARRCSDDCFQRDESLLGGPGSGTAVPPLRHHRGLLVSAGRSRRSRGQGQGRLRIASPAPVQELAGPLVPRRHLRPHRGRDLRHHPAADREGILRRRLGRGQGPPGRRRHRS